MMLFWVLVLVGIVWVVVYVARSAGRSDPPAPHSESPLDILKRRYVAGEITKEQFDEMKKDL